MCIIYYTLPVSNVIVERSFSRLQFLKTYLRSTMAEDRLCNMAILSIKKNVHCPKKNNFYKVIGTFILMKKSEYYYKIFNHPNHLYLTFVP